MKKRLAIILAAVLVAACFAGCGGDDSAAASSAKSEATAEASSEAPAKAESEAPAPETTEASSEAPAESGEVDFANMKVGISMMSMTVEFFLDISGQVNYRAQEAGVPAENVICTNAESDASKQLNDISDLIASGIDVLFLNPVDSAAVGTGVIECNNAGIPVVCIDVSADEGDTLIFTASNNIEMGEIDAQHLVDICTEKYGEPKGTVLMEVFRQVSSCIDRYTGNHNILDQYPDIECVEFEPISITSDDSYNIVTDYLQAYPEGKVDAMYIFNSSTSLGAIAAIKTAGRTDVPLVCTDEDDGILAEIVAPEDERFVVNTVIQHPTDIADAAWDNFVLYLEGKPYEETAMVPVEDLDTPEKVNAFWEYKNAYKERLKDYYF